MYLVARDSDAVCGVLPLTLVRSKFFGIRMVSQAFNNYGGPLVDRPEVSNTLLGHALELCTDHPRPLSEGHRRGNALTTVSPTDGA